MEAKMREMTAFQIRLLGGVHTGGQRRDCRSGKRGGWALDLVLNLKSLWDFYIKSQRGMM